MKLKIVTGILIIQQLSVLTVNGQNDFRIEYLISGPFNNREERIIDDAVQILVDRISESTTLQNTYNILGDSGYNLSRGTWSDSNLDTKPGYKDQYHLLLDWQIRMLKSKGLSGEFPLLKIYSYNDNSNSWGKAPVGVVELKSLESGTKFRTTGEFLVRLNKNHLGENKPGGRDSTMWASIIAHEMLHNLGHDHDDYSDGWQINVFEKSILYDGDYLGEGYENPVEWICAPDD